METEVYESQKTGTARPLQPYKTPAAKRPLFHRPPVVIGAAVAVIALILYIASLMAHMLTHQSTDDAFIDGHIISLAPKVSGKVLSVNVTDNQQVKKGDVILELDPRDYDSLVAQRKAALEVANAKQKSAEAADRQAQAHLRTIAAALKIAEASANATQASTKLSHSDLERNLSLIKTGAISAQDFEHTKSATDTADANLESKNREVDAATAYGDEAKAQAESATAQATAAAADVQQAQAALAQAELQASYTKIVAPEDGRITNKAVEGGDYVQVGQALLAVVPPEVWVTANFKETQITHMEKGQPVMVDVDAYPDRKLRAHVDSIQAGSGSRFSLLPPENATGNFVKVVQRVPVKIVFDEQIDVQRVLGPGMSAVPEVRVNEGIVPLVLMGIVAFVFIVVVIVATRLWLKKAHAAACVS